MFSKTEQLDHLEQGIDGLIAQTQKRICQLIDLELQSCCLSAQFSYLEQQIGSFDRAVREVAEAEKRCQNILRLLPEVADEEQRNEFKAQLDNCCPR